MPFLEISINSYIVSYHVKVHLYPSTLAPRVHLTKDMLFLPYCKSDVIGERREVNPRRWTIFLATVSSGFDAVHAY
jgi:hypothetical protein